MINLSHGDQVFRLVYIIIGNLYVKTCRSQNRPGTLLLDSTPIVYEQVEDSNNKNRDLKAKIYYLALKTMLKYL